MKDDRLPPLRRDLEFYPVQLQGKQYILIRDHLGLVQEGKAVEIPLYQFMILLDGTTTLRDLQLALMRQGGGMLVSTEEVKSVLSHLDEAFLLESEQFKKARGAVVSEFVSRTVRPCSHSGRAYPAEPHELKRKLDEILDLQPTQPGRERKVLALVAPHIDLSVGGKVYSRAYQTLRGMSPKTVIILGTGHQMAQDLFALSDKDFETPLGVAECDRERVRELKAAGGDLIAQTDFAHRTEHSIEFQVLFLQHILPRDSFRIVPILCGNVQTALLAYERNAYKDKTGDFLKVLKGMIDPRTNEVLLVAGVDFSHIGPKFGHEMPAQYMRAESEAHDKALLNSLAARDAELFWKESGRVKDQYNVCGFAALACLLEVLPACKGRLLGYEIWHEEATRSAVSFAAVVFAEQKQQQAAKTVGSKEYEVSSQISRE
ncbi:MAG: AmmeMemoRadiSam system protein B [Deltaproteobacteria bacterium]